MLKTLQNVFFEPRMALALFTLALIGLLVFLDYEGAFQKKFLNFGPSPTTKFLGMTVNSWPKTLLVYTVGFLSSLLTSYYSAVMFDFIHSKLWNPAYNKRIEITRGWARAIVTIEPVLYWVLGIVQFFVNLTMELQFVVPQLLAVLLTNVPYGLFKVSQKRFIGEK